jgi:hypothetical protein
MTKPVKDARMSSEVPTLRRAILYREPSASLDWGKLKKFVESHGVPCEVREDPFSSLTPEALESIAHALAQARILKAHSQELNECVYPVEKAYEYRQLKFPEIRKPGPVYSGFLFQALLASLIPREERDLKHLHVVFTLKRLATWDDARWHLRTILLSLPTVLSISGLVEAPARDREYYLLSSVDPALGETFLSHSRDWLNLHDERMTDVVKGYLLQALFFQWKILQGEDFEFCANPACSLYNSHWQREVLQAQLPHSLCDLHQQEWKLYTQHVRGAVPL